MLVAELKITAENTPDTLLSALDALERAGADHTDVDETVSPPRAWGLFEPQPVQVIQDRLEAASDWTVRILPLTDLKPVNLPCLDQRPIRFGPLTLTGPRPATSPPEPSLTIDTHGAFGNGLHPTTALMLTGIAQCPPRGLILDIGTGTGVLALAALKLGGDRAVATDIDPNALEATKRNASSNHLKNRLTVVSPADLPQTPFAVILANIRPEPLCTLAPQIAKRLGPSGHLWLSGIRFYEASKVVPAFRQHNLSLLEQRLAHGWLCLKMTPAASSFR